MFFLDPEMEQRSAVPPAPPAAEGAPEPAPAPAADAVMSDAANEEEEEEEGEEDDERLCRYCFDGDEEGELISPCNCKGGQRYVHTACLRRWQRMVLVSQPTHPAFYRDDLRHHRCNVCASAFTNAPPTRHELMESFTGPDLAALIGPNYLIGAARVFSDELQRQLASIPAAHRRESGYEHWSELISRLVCVCDVADRSITAA